MKPVLVLSGHVISLGVVRALGKAGIPVYVASYECAVIAHASRYVRGSYRIPGPANEDEFISRLVEIGRTLDRPLLVPGDDASLIAVSRHLGVLDEFYVVSCAPSATVELFIDKTSCYQLAAAAGVPVPRTISVGSAPEAGDASDQVGYPCIIKPVESHFYYDHFGVKFRRVTQRTEAEAAFTEAAQAGVHVMVQEFIAGDDRLGVNYNAYAIDGEARVEFTARKIRMTPPGEGVPSVVMSDDVPEVVDLGRRTLRALNYHGYACTEFKWDQRTGRHVLFEVNGRFNRSNLLATRCGINFPLIDYQHRVLNMIPQQRTFRKKVWWIDEFKDLSSFPRRVRLDPRNLLAFWRPYLWRPVCAMLDWRDPRPFLLRFRQMLRDVRSGHGKSRRLIIRMIFGAMACALLAYVVMIHSFLAVNHPVRGDVLVVESWFHQAPTMLDAAETIRQGSYKHVVCVAVDDEDSRLAAPNADLAVARLTSMGIDVRVLRPLALANTPQDRTFSCALAVKSWLQQHSPETHAVDVFTVGVHARKSWVLYRKAFPPGISVGIIAGRENPYPFSCWWLSRRGIYLTLRNTAGYLYALTFSPPQPGASPPETR